MTSSNKSIYPIQARENPVGWLPHERRAVRLFESLVTRYAGFINGLPEPIRSIAQSRSAYLGQPASAAFEGVASLNPVLAGTPWMFWEEFRGLDDERFITIAEAGTYWVLASIVMDHIVDGQADPVGEVALFHQILQSEGIRAFRSLFSQASGFWGKFDALADRHARGLSTELSARTARRAVELDDLVMAAEGKVAPIVVTIAALTEAHRNQQLYDPIQNSLKNIAVASQLLDDVGDWRQDRKQGHATYFLQLLAPEDFGAFEVWPEMEQLEQINRARWQDVESLKSVAEWLDQSLEAVEGLQCTGWRQYILDYLERTDRHLTAAIANHIAQKLRDLQH